MNVSLALSVQGEAHWQSLRYHVEWAEGFALIVLFSSNPALYGLLRERLVNIYRTRVSHLQEVAPRSADTLVEEVMALIRTPSPLHDAAVAPLWLDVTTNGDAAWERARANLVARLNEHRELLRHRLPRPVILLLPAGYRQRLRTFAPDLWSIRDFSLELDEQEMLRHEATPIGERDPAMGIPREIDTVSRSSQVPTFFEEAQWLEWERLQQRGVRNREMLLAGWRAIEAALSARQLQRAVQIAAEVLNIARELGLQRETPETVRDLSITLNRVGATAQALGQWAEAEAAYRESLGLMRQQRERLGETPETVRDLSIALNRVGATAQALGQWEDARQLYQEALLLGRRLALAFPSHVEYQQTVKRLEDKLTELPTAPLSTSQASARDH